LPLPESPSEAHYARVSRYKTVGLPLESILRFPLDAEFNDGETLPETLKVTKATRTGCMLTRNGLC